MRILYVRQSKEGGYGAGDGSSYDNAWNGFDAVDWSAVAAHEPATVWLCGERMGDEPPGFLTVQVEWGYLRVSAARPALRSAANDPADELESIA
jgi:hypothetical protein